MVCRFIDGFDHLLAADFPNKWGFGGTPPALPTGRFGGVAYRNDDTRGGLARFIDNQATWIVGAAVFFTNFGNGGNALFVFQDSGSNQCELRWNSSGLLYVTRNGTTIATGSTPLVVNVWAYVEFKVTIHNTTGAYEVRVNGSNTGQVSGSGANTRGGTSNNYANSLLLFSGSVRNVAASPEVLVDDLYLLDGTGSLNNDFLGEMRVQTLYPTGTGNYAQFTPSTGANWQNVDDVPENGDTDYNGSSTVNQIDSFALGDLATGTAAPKVVQANLVARKDDVGPRSLAPHFRIGGADYAGAGQALNSTHLPFLQVYDVSPATSVAWTASEVNGAEAGYKLTV